MKKTLTFFAILFLASCQDAWVTGNDPSNTTTLSARVKRAAGVSLSLYDSAITVKVSLVAGSYSQAQTYPFSDGGCDFTGVPIGVSYTLSFQGLDGSGTMIWSGTATGTTASSTTTGGVGSTSVTVVVSNPNDSGPVVVNANYVLGHISRLPDSIAWTAPKDTGSQKQSCNTTTLVCSDTFHLSEPLGTDSLAVSLWTLGIRTYTIYFGEQGSSTTLVLKASSHCDILDTLLLSKYYVLTTDQKASFSALGQGASSLVAYYASLLLSGDTSFVGKSLPVGMSADSVKKDLVYLAQKSGLTVSQLLSKNLGLDSATVLLDVKILIAAKLLTTADSAAIFPPYPVRVKTPITVNGTLTAGGSAVSVSGAFAWTKGQNIKAPAIQVRTAKPGDSVYFTTPTNKFASTDTVWNLDGNLTLQASSSASVGTDTLVVTISDDASHSATSRTAFQVVAPTGQ